MKKMNTMVIIVLLLFLAPTLNVFTDSRDTSGSRTITWYPSLFGNGDGIVTAVHIKWKISHYMSQITFRVDLSFEKIGDKLYLDGEAYSKEELGDIFSMIEPSPASVKMDMTLYDWIGNIRGSGNISHAQVGTTLSLDYVFGVDNEEMRRLYNKDELSLSDFKITRLEFTNLSQARRWVRKENQQEILIEEYLASGKEKYYDQLYEEAIRDFKEVLKLDPDNRSAKQMLGFAEKKLKREERQIALEQGNKEIEQEAEEREKTRQSDAEYLRNQEELKKQRDAAMAEAARAYTQLAGIIFDSMDFLWFDVQGKITAHPNYAFDEYSYTVLGDIKENNEVAEEDAGAFSELDLSAYFGAGAGMSGGWLPVSSGGFGFGFILNLELSFFFGEKFLIYHSYHLGESYNYYKVKSWLFDPVLGGGFIFIAGRTRISFGFNAGFGLTGGDFVPVKLQYIPLIPYFSFSYGPAVFEFEGRIHLYRGSANADVLISGFKPTLAVGFRIP